MDQEGTFSERHGFVVADAPITIRNEAPAWLRSFVVSFAWEAGAKPHALRSLLCDLLLELPDENNWSEGNVAAEVERLLNRAQWFQVYDFVEMIDCQIGQAHNPPFEPPDSSAQERYRAKLNNLFRRKGVGWQLVGGRIEIRGEESFECSVRMAMTGAQETGRVVAGRELHEALHDLSKRPCPDITGAIQHAMAALECVARDVAGDSKATLGEIIKRNPGLLPAPLDTGVAKIWGYASEQGRHLREGSVPKQEQAELVVGLAGALVTYLVKKVPPSTS
jgi:hypothetical protein